MVHTIWSKYLWTQNLKSYTEAWHRRNPDWNQRLAQFKQNANLFKLRSKFILGIIFFRFKNCRPAFTDQPSSGLGSGPSHRDFYKCEDLKDELDLTQPNHELFEIEPMILTNLVRDNSVIAIEAIDPRIETFTTPQKTLVKFTEVTSSASNKKTGFK